MSLAENYPLQKSLTQIFNESAARYHETFSEQLKNLFISSLTEPIYASPEVAGHLTKNSVAVGEMVKKRARGMLGRTAIGTAGEERVSGEMLNYLSLNTVSSGAKDYVSEKFPQEMNTIGVFDHEMGHFVVQNKDLPLVGSSHVRECAADAYAVLRHLQRFGSGTNIFEQAPGAAALLIVIGSSPIHYTSVITQKIASIQRERSIDISSLSLKETAQLAGEIAVKYALDDKTLQKIHDAYAPARQNSDMKKVVMAIAQVMRQSKDDDIYRAGKFFLDFPKMKAFIAKTSEADPVFRSAFDFMEQHDTDAKSALAPREKRLDAVTP